MTELPTAILRSRGRNAAAVAISLTVISCGGEFQEWRDPFDDFPQRDATEPRWDAVGTERLVRAGSFLRKAQFEEIGFGTCERVTLTYDFWIGTTEFTLGEAASLLGCDAGEADEPALACSTLHASVPDAMWFANALSARDGLSACYDLSRCSGVVAIGARRQLDCLPPEVVTDGDDLDALFEQQFWCERMDWNMGFPTVAGCSGYRLPTISEWHWAAAGDTVRDEYCYVREESESRTDYVVSTESFGPCIGAADFVGTKLPNLWGLYDMVGNVLEWAAAPEAAEFHPSYDAAVDPWPHYVDPVWDFEALSFERWAVGERFFDFPAMGGGSVPAGERVFDVPAENVEIERNDYRQSRTWADSWPVTFRLVRRVSEDE